MTSSAARCITLNLPGYEAFHPEFTHQLFGSSETIRGYKPAGVAKLDTKLDQETERDSKRVKFSEAVSPENEAVLDIQIHLNPTCTNCRIELTCQEYDAEDNNARGSNNAGDNSTTETRMTKDEIKQKLQKALPNSTGHFDLNEYLSEPIGKVLKKYENHSKQFVLCLADGKEKKVSEYHDQVQPLALWFIESADCVDVSSDDGGGHWKILYLFEKKEEGKYSLAGYMTLFYFNAPFKRPKGGYIQRICQALVLPPYQRFGHGREMMNSLYKEALNDEAVVEVNVEDPAPSFTSLRDRIDYERLLLSIAEPDNKLSTMRLSSKYIVTDPEVDSFYNVLPTSEAVLIGVHAKIVPRQVQIAHEMFKLNHLLKWLSDSDPKNISLRESSQKKYRLMVKQRLVKLCAEDLGAFDDKKAKQAKLEQIYQEVSDHYYKVLRKPYPQTKE